VERIEESAFAVFGLRSIVIPSSVVVLSKRSFYGCYFLESVTFESGSRLERIGEFAFHMSGLISIEIPESVVFVCDAPFGARYLCSISVSQDNRHFRIRGSFLEDICGATIYQYFGSCTSVVIPSSIVVLGKWSFCLCRSHESVTFESGSRMERIEESAFSGSGFKSILIPASVVVVDKESFCGCQSLESVTFESGSRLERIEEFAFSLTRLESIEIPSSVVFVCSSAFATQSLKSISVSRDNRHFRIRESCLEDMCGATICRYFGSCRSLVIPSYVVVLGTASFHGCQSLQSVTFESGSRLERIGESAFSWTGLKSILIPPSVVVLGKYSFDECMSLESVIFASGSRLEQVEESAFRRSVLKSIEVPSSLVALGKWSFRECTSLRSEILAASRLRTTRQ
jgi:hypothetical protein